MTVGYAAWPGGQMDSDSLRRQRPSRIPAGPPTRAAAGAARAAASSRPAMVKPPPPSVNVTVCVWQYRIQQASAGPLRAAPSHRDSCYCHRGPEWRRPRSAAAARARARTGDHDPSHDHLLRRPAELRSLYPRRAAEAHWQVRPVRVRALTEAESESESRRRSIEGTRAVPSHYL